MREVYIKTEGTEPVTTAELKTFVNYLGSEADFETMLAALGSAARLRLEQYTGRNFVEKTMVMNVDEMPFNFHLPFGPIRDIVSVKTYDEYGVLDETLTADDDYYLIGDFDKFIKFETFASGGYVSIEYRAGYGENTFDLPEAMEYAIKRQTKYDFDNRGNSEAEAINPTVRKLLMPYRASYL